MAAGDTPRSAPARKRSEQLDDALTGASWHQEDFDIDAYLGRLGVERSEPDLALLEQLHRAHVRTIPFATIDVLLRQHPGVSPAAVQRQLIDRRRGGYCFEHGQIFVAALEDLGYDVRRRLGRAGTATSSRTHMSAEVRLGEDRYLVDPGFGMSISGPLSLAPGTRRQEAAGTYTIRHETLDGADYWNLQRDGEDQHTVDALRVEPIDVRTGHLITSDSPHSGMFLQMPIVMKHTDEGHVTVAGTTRTVRTPGAPTRREELSADEFVDAVRDLDVHLDEQDAERLREVVEQLRREAAPTS